MFKIEIFANDMDEIQRHIVRSNPWVSTKHWHFVEGNIYGRQRTS